MSSRPRMSSRNVSRGVAAAIAGVFVFLARSELSAGMTPNSLSSPPSDRAPGRAPKPRLASPSGAWASCLTSDAETGDLHIDPNCFFEALVERYRSLTVYEDQARVLEVIRRGGKTTHRIETRIGCEVADDTLRVETIGSRLRGALGLGFAGLRTSPAWEEARLEYDLWLAPHMKLKFAPQPMQEFRAGVRDGFTAIEAEAVQVGDRTMVHLELKSGDGLSDEPEAAFDLWVNPDSMLVERITGQQWLADGGRYETTVDITPMHVEGGREGDTRPAEGDAEPLVDPRASSAVADPTLPTPNPRRR